MLITIFILGFICFVIICIKAGDIKYQEKNPVSNTISQKEEQYLAKTNSKIINNSVNDNVIMLKRPLDIIKESAAILNETVNIETALDRYDTMLNNITYIKNNYTERQILLIGLKSKKDLLEDEAIFLSDDYKVKVFNNIICRAYKQRLEIVSKFKRVANKEKNIALFFEKIKDLDRIPQQCKTFCDDLLIAYKQDLATQNNCIDKFISNIPKEIINLLWFIDGPLKNTNNTDAMKKTCNINNIISFTVNYNNAEPSLISEKYPIGAILNSAPKLDYFPTYAGLTPNQRATYLNWLKDIKQPIDIGYVFIFFYGLERYLYLTTKFEEAFRMVLKLRKYHGNNYSFNAYSIDSLIGSALVNKRLDLIKSLIALAPEEHELTALELACMASLDIPLTAKQVVSLANSARFYNKRYIKLHYELFINTLENVLQEKYNEKTFPMYNSYLNNTEKYNSIRLAANISLTQCETVLYRVNTNTNFINNIFDVLQETHNSVKEILKQRRKEDNKENKRGNA